MKSENKTSLDEGCCTVFCETPLDQNYWDAQYKSNVIGWDLGQISPAIKMYIDTLSAKNSAILIPGCGTTYEAEYLLEQGFTNVTVIDIAPTLVDDLKRKFKSNPNITIVLGDFFQHQGKYDLIIEQTFFCALPPLMRQHYVWKMHQLLSNKGKLAGLLFNRNFDINPPFGGSKEEYEQLFKAAFYFSKLGISENSIPQRKNSELFFEFEKNDSVCVALYHFEGITCSGCKNTVSQKFSALDQVQNVSMNTAFNEVLIVSDNEVSLQLLQDCIVYDEKYKISLINFLS
jgi:SAM-dependent methyltransferase